MDLSPGIQQMHPQPNQNKGNSYSLYPDKTLNILISLIEKTNERKVIFEVERDIYPNEELFIDYGLTYDRSQYTTR